MFPDRYPAEPTAIALGIIDSSKRDKTPDYWKSESNELVAQFERRVRDRVSRHELDHLSVFALAPQPLLILLGTLLGDIVPADVYQRHREPPTWSWPSTAAPLSFKSREHLSQFRAVIRPLFDRIKAVHGQGALLHVFPVAPVSLAVEFGRARMPKADMPWCVYDQNNERGGFVVSLNVPLGE